MRLKWILLATLIGYLSWLPAHRPVEAQGGLLVVSSPADVTGSGVAVQVATSGTARWIQVIAQSANSAVVRCGDSNVSATRGLPIAAGGGFMFAPMPVDGRQAVNQHYYNLAAVYCYIANSDKVSFAWAN